MALAEEIISTDPVLRRVFFDDRRFAPMPCHDAIVNIALSEISELKKKFLKARTVDEAENLVNGYMNHRRHFHGIRRFYFLLRRHCAGYRLKLPAGHDDGCEHVVMFSHDERDPFFNIDYKARAAYRHRHGYRPRIHSRH